jgi:hypothetical protein
LEIALNKSAKVLEKFKVKDAEVKSEAKEEKPIVEIEIANATNITCGYCQYLVNNTCMNYTCCKDDECKANQTCINHECVALECGYCQYVENHKCVDYECCVDEDCGANQTCSEHKCIAAELEKKCPSYCGEDTNCSIVYCNASTDYKCKRLLIVPCCGNKKCELSEGENESNCPEDCEGVLEALYCEQDSDCVPCCATWRLLENGSYLISSRTPFGVCVNKDYTYLDLPTLCRHTMCGREMPPCIKCNKCVNNQCVTTYAKCPWE